jgi:serine/threonine-protein kinase HipA
MNRVYRRAKIYVQSKYAGILQESDTGYQFTYDQKYLASDQALPVSLTLPLQTEPFESKVLFSFFDGLIPEGWLLQEVSRNWKIERNDRFGVLLVACEDCTGDVSVRREETL